MYEYGAPPPSKRYQLSVTPEYGVYYGTVLQVMQAGRANSTLVLVWRRVSGEWRVVAYRAMD